MKCKIIKSKLRKIEFNKILNVNPKIRRYIHYSDIYFDIDVIDKLIIHTFFLKIQ